MNELNSSAQQYAINGNVGSAPKKEAPAKKSGKVSVVVCVMLAIAMLFLAGYLVYYRISTTKANAQALTGTWVCNKGYNSGRYECGSFVYKGEDKVTIDGGEYDIKIASKGMVVTSGSDTYSLTYAVNDGLVVVGGEAAAKLFGGAAGNISDTDYGVVLHLCSRRTNLSQSEIDQCFKDIFKVQTTGTLGGSLLDGLIDNSGSSGMLDDLLGGLLGGSSDNSGLGDMLGGLFGGSDNSSDPSNGLLDGLFGDSTGNGGTSSGQTGGFSLDDLSGLLGGLFGGSEDTSTDDTLPAIGDLSDLFG